jgi:ABC-2 type transport system permease protein
MIPVLVKRDFMSRVTGTAYIITTVLGILVFVGLSFIPPLMDHFVHSFTPRNIDLVVYEQPTTTSMVPYLQEIGEELGDTRIRTVQGVDEREAYRMVVDEDLTGLLLIDGPLYTLVTTDGSNMTVNTQIEGLVNRALTRANAERLGISDGDMATLFQRIDLRVREIGPQGDDGAEIDSVAHTQAMVLAYFLLFMIYMALIMYGNMVASGVAEEKSSRIMEVMVSTVKPLELMFGKIIGVGALGLLQFLIWTGTGLLMTTMGKTGLLGGMLGIADPLSTIPLSTVLWFGLYFLLGYFFYASIFAAGGALVSRVEEVSQVVTIIMMLIIVGFIAAYVSFANPNSNFAVVTSLIPFTSPMVMFARIVLANPPLSQVIASVIILVLSVIIGAWISSKIYRIGILLYGKRPSVRQVVGLLKDWD